MVTHDHDSPIHLFDLEGKSAHLNLSDSGQLKHSSRDPEEGTTQEDGWNNPAVATT